MGMRLPLLGFSHRLAPLPTAARWLTRDFSGTLFFRSVLLRASRTSREALARAVHNSACVHVEAVRRSMSILSRMISSMGVALTSSAANFSLPRGQLPSWYRFDHRFAQKKAVLCHHRMLTHRGIGHCILRTLAHAKTKKGISNR